MIRHPQLGDFRLIRPLGSGGFSMVFLAESVSYKFQVAIKRLKDDNHGLNEARIASSANNLFVVEVFDVFKFGDSTYVMMEYIHGESLVTYIKSKGHLEDAEAKALFIQLAFIVYYLHNVLHISHRDIKCDNILVDKKGNLRLIDYGFAKDGGGIMNTKCGSPTYAAPELILGRAYTNAIDIWAMGIVLYAMGSGYLPFNNKNIQILYHDVINQSINFPDHMHPQMADLIGRMLHKEPNLRLEIEEVLSHPWLMSMYSSNNSNSSDPLWYQAYQKYVDSKSYGTKNSLIREIKSRVCTKIQNYKSYNDVSPTLTSDDNIPIPVIPGARTLPKMCIPLHNSEGCQHIPVVQRWRSSPTLKPFIPLSHSIKKKGTGRRININFLNRSNECLTCTRAPPQAKLPSISSRF